MKAKSSILSLLALASLLTLSGCIAAIGNETPPASNATLGQQLIDLQKARDTGVITEAEYQTQRARFLDKK